MYLNYILLDKKKWKTARRGIDDAKDNFFDAALSLKSFDCPL